MVKYPEIISSWSFQAQKIAFQRIFRYEPVVMKLYDWVNICKLSWRFINPFQPSVACHIETCHLVFAANEMTGFCMKCNTGLKWGDPLIYSPNAIKNFKFRFSSHHFGPSKHYLLKVNNRNTEKGCEIYLKSTLKVSEGRQ